MRRVSYTAHNLCYMYTIAHAHAINQAGVNLIDGMGMKSLFSMDHVREPKGLTLWRKLE